MIMNKIKIGMFGDSYISLASTWIKYLKEHNPYYDIKIYGKGGANLYYAIRMWQTTLDQRQESSYDWAFFTLTWPERLFSIWPYRNEQFCARNEFRKFEKDCTIINEEDNQEFLKSIDLYYKYIYDTHWRDFDYEQEIRWIMELPEQHPKTRFVIIPNTEQSRIFAKKYHRGGILLDFAFETLSNLEPNSPGPMPVIDMDRNAHLNDHNHHKFAEIANQIICNTSAKDAILPVDLNQFDIVKHD
jgi:hypothetical protein